MAMQEAARHPPKARTPAPRGAETTVLPVNQASPVTAVAAAERLAALKISVIATVSTTTRPVAVAAEAAAALVKPVVVEPLAVARLPS
jgi:hypothetical protein